GFNVRLDLAHLAEGAVDIHGIKLVGGYAVRQQREGEAGERSVVEATGAGGFLDVPKGSPALRPAVREFILAVHQIGAERVACDTKFAHHVRRQLIGLGGLLVNLLEQSLKHGLGVFDVAEIDYVPLEISGLNLGLELGK